MNAFLLNTLWLVMCLPILTIFPATTAMFGVVREWQKHKDVRILSAFFRHLKDNFRQSFLLGLLWLVFTCLLIGDFIITNQLHSNLKYVLFSFFFLLTIVYVFVTVTIFPVLVHYRVSWKDAIKHALLLAIGNLFSTLLALVIIAAAVGLVFYFPAATILCFGISSFLIYALVSRGFHQEKKVQVEGKTVAV